MTHQKIKIEAKPATITLKNIWTEDEVIEKDVALESLDTTEGVKYNTGLNALSSTTAPAILADDEAWKAQHIAAIRLYGGNSYVHLLPGDEITITTKSANETVYYAFYQSELLSVDAEGVIIPEGDVPSV